MNNQPSNIDLDWVQRLLGSNLPSEFRRLHESGESETLDNIIVDQEDENGNELYFCISHWTKQLATEYDADQHYNQLRLLISRDHSGNILYALPQEQFETIYQFDHETRTSLSLGIDIPTMINLAREAKRQDEEETEQD